MISLRMVSFATLGLHMIIGGGCTPPPPNQFDTMETADINIKGTTFRAWVADDNAETTSGLMGVKTEDLAPLQDGTQRGMIFIFDQDKSRYDGFWMKNVAIPLDIAFIRSDGSIVSIMTMAAYDESIYRPDGSYRYALEVRANLFSELGITESDTVEIPEEIRQS